MSSSSLDTHPRRNADCAFKAIGEDGGLVVLPDRSEVKVLNAIGIRIFALVDGTRSVRDIVRTICDEYEVTPDAAEKDVLAFLEDLRKGGMLADSGGQPKEVPS